MLIRAKEDNGINYNFETIVRDMGCVATTPSMGRKAVSIAYKELVDNEGLKPYCSWIKE